MVHRQAAAVSIVCNVIQGQDEAIIDVSDADLGLADLVRPQVIAGGTEQDPVGVQLEPGVAEDAFALVREAGAVR